MYFLVDLYSARVGGRVEEGVEEEEEEGLLLGKIDAKHRYFLHKY
jgi:hypothetical protein